MERLKKIFFSETFCFCVVLFSFVGVILSAIIFLFFSGWKFSWRIDEAIIGQFGDFVGGVIGTLLAFAASLLYFIALKEQQKDVKTNQDALNQQIEEFRKQVEELEKSRLVNQLQLNMITLQQYEGTFYSYFNIYTQIKDKITNENNKHSLHSIIEKLGKAVISEQVQTMSPKNAYLYAINEYSKLFVKERTEVSHYFRTLYRLLTIADSCPLKDETGGGNKMKYVKIIRSQLSDEELLLIYYNCHSIYAGKSRHLISQYNLLKHLSPIHKFEIVHRFQLPDEVAIQIENFYDLISPSIINFINSVCDNPDKAHEEMEVKNMNCIFKMEYDENIVFSIVCRQNNTFSTKLTEVFLYLLYDLLFLSQFEYEDKNVVANRLQDVSTGYAINTYTIKAEDIKKITTDK